MLIQSCVWPRYWGCVCVSRSGVWQVCWQMSPSPQLVLWGLWSHLSLNESHLLGFWCGGRGEQSETHSRKDSCVCVARMFVGITGDVLYGHSLMGVWCVSKWLTGLYEWDALKPHRVTQFIHFFRLLWLLCLLAWIFTKEWKHLA